MRYVFILLLALTVLFVGCSKPVTLKFDGTNYYQVVQYQQVAYGYNELIGTNWFQLRNPDQSFGEMNGQTMGKNEEWIPLTKNGSHVYPYHRTLETGNNTNLMPVFVME
jgi:hypothetical protein